MFRLTKFSTLNCSDTEAFDFWLFQFRTLLTLTLLSTANDFDFGLCQLWTLLTFSSPKCRLFWLWRWKFTLEGSNRGRFWQLLTLDCANYKRFCFFAVLTAQLLTLAFSDYERFLLWPVSIADAFNFGIGQLWTLSTSGRSNCGRFGLSPVPTMNVFKFDLFQLRTLLKTESN